MQNLRKVYLFIFLLVIFFITSFGYLFYKVISLERIVTSLTNQLITTNKSENKIDILSPEDSCSEVCKKEIENKISQAVATISATKTTISKSTIVSKSEAKTAYIPLSGPITTTSTGWVDVVGTDIYIDLANDYGKNAYVSWEAFLKVAYGNGQAFARLYDVTHGIGVDGSELSLIGIGTSTQVSSGKLNLWSGRNLYRVQIKSLNTFEVTFGSGRIKITY
jgi:Flp pilus assembly protein TadG